MKERTGAEYNILQTDEELEKGYSCTPIIIMS